MEPNTQTQSPEQKPGNSMPPPRGGNEDPGQPAATGMADAFQRVVMAAMRVLYTPQTRNGVVSMLQKGSPVNALAQTTLMVMKALFDQSKGKIPGPVMIPAARAVLTLVAEMGNAMGLQMGEEQSKQAMQLVEGSLAKHFGPPAEGEEAPESSPERPADSAQGGEAESQKPKGIVSRAMDEEEE